MENSGGVFENCDIHTNTLAGVAVATGGNPTVRYCAIHHEKGAGVWVFENGRGVFEDCDLRANAEAGVGVMAGRNPTLRRCAIHDGRGAGLSIAEGGHGIFEHCGIAGNKPNLQGADAVPPAFLDCTIG